MLQYYRSGFYCHEKTSAATSGACIMVEKLTKLHRNTKADLRLKPQSLRNRITRNHRPRPSRRAPLDNTKPRLPAGHKEVPVGSTANPFQPVSPLKNIFSRMASGVTFILALIFLTLPANNSRAAEDRQIRLGDDYSILSVPDGRGYRWCERTCNRDARCRSWTYIRPNALPQGQCRLKHSVAPAFSNRCCVSGVKQQKADAAPTLEDRCARYARVALEQQDDNLARSCGYRGSRWHRNYGLHYRWCLTTPARTRNKERLARDTAACVPVTGPLTPTIAAWLRGQLLSLH